ncbi:glyoxalase domain-containing protein 4 isoform X3 [Homalodisca vitripennis]|uniref:glyoxalase domain-containing protein 4 isoform X3 n=1 Tax=Homalodisca vitripennis TaxID=197043 RepID=UPI001EEBD461|nr:glyoxalase domain-containing protein 4 isoform X3 [Homalodisca vitripennis]XP_046680476.1 glyoxalase domain-containing protein 4 isoform X3 [Homalodisca vitripennis]
MKSFKKDVMLLAMAGGFRPYDNRWSKTMVGYGPEDNHFVVELTYNYNVNKYEQGNDYQGITIRSREAIARAKAAGWPIREENGLNVVEAPGGYKYFLVDEPQPTDRDPVEKVTLSSSNLARTLAYWNGILGLKIFSQDKDKAVLGFAESQAKLEFKDIGKPVEHATAYGRIAYSVPAAEQPAIHQVIKDTNNKILTPLITLDTPGKASVTVIILADPDDHEICFVDDESFRILSEVDPKAEPSLFKYIEKDENRKKV